MDRKKKEVLTNRLKELPQQQREDALQCFENACVKPTEMRYNFEFI